MTRASPPRWPSLFVASGLLLTTRRAAADEWPDVPEEPKNRTEKALVPVVGGDSDVGVGGGFTTALQRIEEGYKPYKWRLEAATMITFKPAPDGGIDVPLQEYQAKIILPHLLRDAWRFEIRPSFSWLSTLKYYGLGNASIYEAESLVPSPPRFFEYGRRSPAVRTQSRLTLARGHFALLGLSYTHNWIDVPADGKLATDMRSGSAAVKEVLGRTDPHGVARFEYGYIYDTRENEVSPTKGAFHQATFRLSPGSQGSILPYQYAQANFIVRFYQKLGTPRLVLATRVIADFFFGDTPFYELTRYEDSNAIGGASGVRGVPAQRYYGKAKVLGNIEVRADFFDFRISHKKFSLGGVAFFDAGRLWADYVSHPELDGTGLGLKYGVGGGLRIKSGTSFVVRMDLAYSPDARPIGVYFGAGHAS